MSQLSLFPIRLVDEFEADRSKSKDLLWTGIDDQDRRYALKTVEPDNPALPMTEWICYQLCLRCNIPAPDFSVVARKNGTMALGSRWEENADQYSPSEVTMVQLALWLSQTTDDVSAMFIFDCFLPNSDRHMGNILFRRTPRRRALAFDWSRVTLFNPWPLAMSSNTKKNMAWLQGHGLYNPRSADSVLDKLRLVTHTDLEEIINAAPNEWGDAVSNAALINWWKTNKDARIDSLK